MLALEKNAENVFFVFSRVLVFRGEEKEKKGISDRNERFCALAFSSFLGWTITIASCHRCKEIWSARCSPFAHLAFLVTDNLQRKLYEKRSGLSKANGKGICVGVVTMSAPVSVRWLAQWDRISSHLIKGCCAYFCCPCFCCQVYSRAGEWLCTPFFCCWPDSLMSLRMKIRTGFRLQVRLNARLGIFLCSFLLASGLDMDGLSRFGLLSVLSITANQ